MTDKNTSSLSENDSLFEDAGAPEQKADRRSMTEELPRIDGDEQLRERLLPCCRLQTGDVWEDPKGLHRITVGDTANRGLLAGLIRTDKPVLIVADPPYNIIVGARNTSTLFQRTPTEYDEFSEQWVRAVLSHAASDASFYVWLGADYKNGFHPVPEFCQLMRQQKYWIARNWITVRNQRGFGTQKNWMWVRQELFYYTRGTPIFNVNAEYTDIPKVLRGYYKHVNGRMTENLERGKSNTIRAGNVWIDIQQVFYRMEENVPGCYAQKPLKSVERNLEFASSRNDIVFDPFVHSGTTLIAGERLGRRVMGAEIDPIFAEIAIGD